MLYLLPGYQDVMLSRRLVGFLSQGVKLISARSLSRGKSKMPDHVGTVFLLITYKSDPI